MPAFHPPLSSSPFAFLLLLCICELALQGKRRAHLPIVRTVLVSAIMCGSALAFMTGYQASADAGVLSTGAEEALSTHHAVGRMVLISSMLLAIVHWTASIATVRREAFRAAYFIVLAIVVCLTIWAGSMGGSLVFRHRIGVEALLPSPPTTPAGR